MLLRERLKLPHLVPHYFLYPIQVEPVDDGETEQLPDGTFSIRVSIFQEVSQKCNEPEKLRAHKTNRDSLFSAVTKPIFHVTCLPRLFQRNHLSNYSFNYAKLLKISSKQWDV